MITAKLVGNVWATRKTQMLNGFKLMLAEVIGGAEDGKRMVVVDQVGAGIGDRVLVVFGSAARRMVQDDTIPVDAAVVGIIDDDCTF